MSNASIIGIIQMHGGDDYSVWFPDIPADEPLLAALLDKYADSGSSVRGNVNEIRAEISELLGETEPENTEVHVLLYNDPQCNYVGLDVFASFNAALQQFRQRLKETKDEHLDDPDWIEVLDERPENGELHFRDRDEYEVFYCREVVQ